jgi:PEP-CTERM motif
VNTGTAALTDVGSIGFASVFGMASPNGADLYGFSDNRVLTINAATGAGSLLSTANGPTLGAVFGSAFFSEAAPVIPPVPAVPEPSTYALLIAGLLGVGAMAKRKRKA